MAKDKDGFTDNMVITVLSNGNPKRRLASDGKTLLKSWQRFNFYLDNPGCTVGEYKAWCALPAQWGIAAKGVTAADLIWETDPRRNYIAVALPVATPAPVSGTVAAIAAHAATLPAPAAIVPVQVPAPAKVAKRK